MADDLQQPEPPRPPPATIMVGGNVYYLRSMSAQDHERLRRAMREAEQSYAYWVWEVVVIVLLQQAEIALALRHAEQIRVKIEAHRRLRNTYKTSAKNPHDLQQLCRIGFLGEYAFRKAIGVPIPQEIEVSLDHFDGGRDVRWGSVWVQVKSAIPRAHYSERNPPWLLSPKANSLRDSVGLIALTVPWTNERVEIMGVISAKRFREKAVAFPYDTSAMGVKGGLMPMEKAIHIMEKEAVDDGVR